MPTQIEWADEVWNLVIGCTKVSPGCRHCYAERMSQRFGLLWPQVTLHPERLALPFRWRKRRVIFACSMGDLFHTDVPTEFLTATLRVCRDRPRHTFLLLSKRAERMAAFFHDHPPDGWPDEYRHVWVGVSCEDQAAGDERIPSLLEIGGWNHFVSAEPLLGPLDLTRYLPRPDFPAFAWMKSWPFLAWVVAGGESGPGFRPMKTEWPVALRDQCKETGVPFFFKQGSGIRPGLTPHLPDGAGGEREYREVPWQPLLDKGPK